MKEMALREMLGEGLAELVLEAEPVGSRITCDPPVMDTDEDWLLLVKSLPKFRAIATKVFGWDLGSSLEGMENFASFDKGDVNLIVTEKREFFHKFMCASDICKRLNVLEKEDRIFVFQAVLYGNRYGSIE